MSRGTNLGRAAACRRALLAGAGIFLLEVLCAGAFAQAPAPAPQAQLYLYVEPYQIRVEALVKAAEMEKIAGATGPLFSGNDLSVEAQTKLKDLCRPLAEGWLALKLDEHEVPAKLLSVSLVKGVPGRTEPLGEKDPVPVSAAMVGLVWEAALPGVPQKVGLEWRGFSETLPTLPGTVFSGGPPQDFTLTPQEPSHVWTNDGQVNLRQPLVEVPSVPESTTLRVPLSNLLGAICLFTLWLVSRRIGWSPMYMRGLLAGLLAVLLALNLANLNWTEIPIPGRHPAPVTTQDAEHILNALLRNTYRAFDQTDEGAIYDVLARSVDGKLLQKIYLQTIQSLTLDGQDGTRVKISEFYVRVDAVSPLAGTKGFVATCQWNALGMVGHWGHVHMRSNRYTAKITVADVNGAWKMTGLEVLEERRI